MVTATSVSDPTKSAQATIVIGLPSVADGTYVFSLSGLQSPSAQPYFVSGVFVVSGGAITGGEQDYREAPQPPTFSGAATDLINSSGGNISTSVDGNVKIVLATCNGTDCTSTDANVGVNGVETLDASAVSPTRFLVSEFDASHTANGTIDLQTSTTTPSGGYAFEIRGTDIPNVLPIAIGGIINIDGSGTISGYGSVFDINDGSSQSGFGHVLTDGAFGPSTVTAPDGYGRVVFNLVPSAASNIASIILAGYIVDATHIRLVEDSDPLGFSTGGTALGQGASTGSFSSTTLAGSSFVFSALGKDANTNFNFQVAGVLTTNADLSVSGTLNLNDLSQDITTPIPFTGTYTVDPTGRVTLSNLTDGTGIFTFNDWQFYLTGSGAGTVGTMASMDNTTSADGGDVLAGFVYQQTGGPFTAASFSGKYVMDATGTDSNGSELDAVGPITADGTSTFTGTVDLNWLFHTGAVQDLTVSGSFAANSNGVFTGNITGLDVSSPTNNDAFTYYVIDTTKVVAIQTDNNQLTLAYFECTSATCPSGSSSSSKAESTKRKPNNQ